MVTERRERRMREVLGRRWDDLAVVIENVHDAHNASAILRSCDAFGAGRVVLCYTKEEFPKISGGAAGKVQKWLEIERSGSAADCVAGLRERGMRVYATCLDEDAADYAGVDWRGASAIVLGNEHRGCSEEMLELADGRVRIPMAGFADSLNVSVAAAVLLAEAARQRRSRPLPAWTAEREALLESWLERERRRG